MRILSPHDIEMGHSKRGWCGPRITMRAVEVCHCDHTAWYMNLKLKFADNSFLTTPTLFVRCLFLKILFSSALVVWKISPFHCTEQAALHHRSACKCASCLVLMEKRDKRAANKRPRCCPTQNPMRGHRRLLGLKTKYFTASKSEQVWWVEDSRPEDKSYANLSAPLS